MVSTAAASGVESSVPGAPVADMMEVSESTRSGCSMATVWAIIPPMETPTTCALSIFRWSSRPMASAAMSDRV